jgi:hypothetical protein
VVRVLEKHLLIYFDTFCNEKRNAKGGSKNSLDRAFYTLLRFQDQGFSEPIASRFLFIATSGRQINRRWDEAVVRLPDAGCQLSAKADNLRASDILSRTSKPGPPAVKQLSGAGLQNVTLLGRGPQNSAACPISSSTSIGKTRLGI